MRPLPPYPPRVYLKPGELYVAKEPVMVETVLGSCIAVSFYCESNCCGAICHAMLPAGKTAEYKYVDAAINYMLATLKQHGMETTNVVAKLFGGADMFDNRTANKSAKFSVGRQNIEMARSLLRKHGIAIQKSDVGGNYGRKLIFFSETGRVFIKKLDRKTLDASLQLVGVNRHGQN